MKEKLKFLEIELRIAKSSSKEKKIILIPSLTLLTLSDKEKTSKMFSLISTLDRS